ncbi:hypothetical protein DESC_780365 [Desulfosarcina cetonica]|nr:hypothetical protein DESC_780365 [Desulfosarcina cetonica]
MSEIDNRMRHLIERLHRLSAFRAEEGRHIVLVQYGLTGQINEKKAFFIPTGFALAIVAVVVGLLPGVGRKRTHGSAATRTKNGGQVVAIHDQLLSQFNDKWAFNRMCATFAGTIKSGRHIQNSL